MLEKRYSRKGPVKTKGVILLCRTELYSNKDRSLRTFDISFVWTTEMAITPFEVPFKIGEATVQIN